MKPVRYWKGKAPEGYKEQDSDVSEDELVAPAPVQVQKEAFVVISTGPAAPASLPLETQGDKRLMRLQESLSKPVVGRENARGICIKR